MNKCLLWGAIALASMTLMASPAQAEPLPANVSWHEGFEAANDNDLFWLPDGWTAKRTEAFVNTSSPSTWCVTRQINAFYPEPVEGTHYAVAYYNDDEEQDEWIYTDTHTPKTGEYLTYYATLLPFWLYDGAYFDQETETFSRYELLCDMQSYISVEGGEWKLINSLFETYKETPASELYDLAHNGYVSNRKMFIDMAEYVGHEVRFAFRYVGKGGSSIYLDNIELCKPELTASYEQPQSALYFGMTDSFEQPSTYLYLPDETEISWWNSSSMEALSFEWKYADTNDLTKTSTSTEADLRTTYHTYVSEANQLTGNENIAQLPVLSAKGVAGTEDTFTLPAAKAQIGGKAQIKAGDKVYKTGASNCNPVLGHTILTASNDAPIFGVGTGSKALWTGFFGLSGNQTAEVTGFGSVFAEPLRPYTLRGVHIQGVGMLDKQKLYAVSASVRQRDPIYGSMNEAPIATAILDAEHITEEAIEGSEMKRYTLPFLFADPVTVSDEIWVMVDGLEKASTWFAPLQTAEIEAKEELSQAVFEVEYFDGSEKMRGIYYASNLTLFDDQQNEVPCYYNFFVNLDMAYGDCDDWGHLDITQPLPPMPEILTPENTMKMISMDEPNNEELMLQFNMRCGFYDETDAEKLTVYACIGELYEYEGGAFYSDDLYDTFVVKMVLNKSDMGKELSIENGEVSLDFYNIYEHAWTFSGTHGTVSVSDMGNHRYGIEAAAMDLGTMQAMVAHMHQTDTWRWRDYNEERPDPNQFDIKKNGRVTSHHDILSCVVDESNPELPVIWLASKEGLTTVSEVVTLANTEYVRIQIPASLMDGLYKGFSGWSDDNLTVTYKGVNYNHSGCANDETCYGGNVIVESYDRDNLRINISSTIFTMISENYSNMNLHYKGAFVFDNTASGIATVADAMDANHTVFDLNGRQMHRPLKGMMMVDKRKIILQK